MIDCESYGRCRGQDYALRTQANEQSLALADDRPTYMVITALRTSHHPRNSWAASKKVPEPRLESEDKASPFRPGGWEDMSAPPLKPKDVGSFMSFLFPMW
ncbi:hypothetical protein SAY87_027584 [Trapa incisa]|uniref:Uncharacterized protein n=1 Tax=Trapa incisa TaxID=236973 RepID=A0AAN7JMP8_9MYRT|nr:hypothetical protein SAY87_027584 [Trapa incisa]